MFQRCFYAILMHAVHLLGSMGLASQKVNAEMSVKIVVADRPGPVRHGVHRGCIYMTVVLYQYRPAAPAPVSDDALHNFGILRCKRLRITMIRAAPALASENFSGFYILHLKL